ncbi:unnamed protein product, partial [Amoebophrya sp. A25]|eukprot:GSA25T00015190001.1
MALAKQEMDGAAREFNRLTKMIRREQSHLLRLERDFEEARANETVEMSELKQELDLVCQRLGERQGAAAELEVLRRLVGKVEIELGRMEGEYEIKRKVLEAGKRDLEQDLGTRRSSVIHSDQDQAQQQSMIQLRLDQMTAFDTRMAEHETTYKLKRTGLQNWLADNRAKLSAAQAEIGEQQQGSSLLQEDGYHDNAEVLADALGTLPPPVLNLVSPQDMASTVGPLSQARAASKKNSNSSSTNSGDALRARYEVLNSKVAQMEQDCGEKAKTREAQIVQLEIRLANLFREREEARRVRDRSQKFLAAKMRELEEQAIEAGVDASAMSPPGIGIDGSNRSSNMSGGRASSTVEGDRVSLLPGAVSRDSATRPGRRTQLAASFDRFFAPGGTRNQQGDRISASFLSQSGRDGRASGQGGSNAPSVSTVGDLNRLAPNS